ncbi:stage II sporulation protein M [Halobacillus sp. A5]|uniref:stage II sporulation protein M n=1 Tax=Halobacillus sp. A5 TaxID=2880263 RepID=UPI0020A62C1C|nr:stage II sporulation protein M [Halobacillus sp. A5]MCP3027037.1 stage II sporulation protein M [Halobacillus sp. A5]
MKKIHKDKSYKNVIPVKLLFFIYILVFIVGIILGYLFINVENIALNPTEVDFRSIFVNNFTLSVTLVIGGLLTFGVISFLIIFINGLVIGELIKVLELNNSMFSFFHGLLPHLIIELPALILFAICGTFSGHILLMFLRNKVSHHIISLYIKIGVAFFIFGTVLLFVASLIEDYISFV